MELPYSDCQEVLLSEALAEIVQRIEIKERRDSDAERPDENCFFLAENELILVYIGAKWEFGVGGCLFRCQVVSGR